MILERVKSLLMPNVSVDAKLTVVSMFLGKTLDSHGSQIGLLEKRQLEKGDKGDSIVGPTGPRGADGKSGTDGKSITGPKGDKGDTGAVGKAGKAGVSVVDAEVAADDHLVLKLSDGKIIDAGELPTGRMQQASVHVAGNAWQIHVGDTPPANPYANQIWFATNLTSACT